MHVTLKPHFSKVTAELPCKKLPNSVNFQRSIVIPFRKLFLLKKDYRKYLKKHTNFGASYPLNLHNIGGKEKLNLVQNINGRLIPTAEVTSLIEQTTKARITEIYLFKKTNKQIFARYFGLQYKPSSGAERKRKVRNVKGSLQRRFKI